MNVDNLMPDSSRYEAFAERHRRDGYTSVTINECDVCGLLSWACSAKDGPEITVLSTDSCQRCAQAHARGPEIVEWMAEVVAKAQKDVLKALLPKADD